MAINSTGNDVVNGAQTDPTIMLNVLLIIFIIGIIAYIYFEFIKN